MSEPSTIIHTLRYRDAKAAIDWLGRAFGFERHVVYEDDEVVHHAQLTFGTGMVMLGSVREAEPGTYQALAPPPGSGTAYAVVADPDGLLERARGAGAEIVRGPEDTDYGSREFTARDPEGNLWSFGTYDPWADAE